MHSAGRKNGFQQDAARCGRCAPLIANNGRKEKESMKHLNRSMTYILAAALVVSIGLLFAGCGNEQQETEKVPRDKAVRITLTITYPKKVEPENYSTQTVFRAEKGTSLLDAMQLVCKINNIPLNVDTTTDTIEGINDVNNGDLKHYVWKCRVNGTLREETPDKIKMKNGDSIEMMYVREK